MVRIGEGLGCDGGRGPLNSVSRTQQPLSPEGPQAQQEPVLLRVPEVKTTPTSSAFGVAEKRM